jgi:SAM-dependent methyltransferase
MTPDARLRFLEKFEAAWRAGTFIKLTLSEYRGAEEGLRNAYGRAVELRAGRRLSLLSRYATRDVTRNLSIEEALTAFHSALGTDWESAHLFTATGDWRLQCDASGRGKLKASRPAIGVVPAPEHDRQKHPALTAAQSPWLRTLGVTNASGEAHPGMAPKLRQIRRFVELLGHLLDDSPLRESRELRVVDMGAGKGYLTFAAAEFFRGRGIAAEIVGVEARAELVELTNHAAREHGFTGLRFERGSIGDWQPSAPPEVLLALHACDTATDDALAQAVRAGASLILTAPCCHKQVRAQLAPPSVLLSVLRHGILAEREAEIVTDGLRALLLEIHGYAAKVFEFISPEETSKNLMLAAHRRAQPQDAGALRAQLRDLMAFYGIREQRLVSLLEGPPIDPARPVS